MRYDKAVEFFETFQPGGPWTPAALPREGGAPVVRTFTDKKDLFEWLVSMGPSNNLYLHVNPLTEEISRKARLTDVKEVRYLHLDSDVSGCPPSETNPAEHLAREQRRILRSLQDAVPKPNVIVFSGGGYQAYWRLREPIQVGGDEAKGREATAYNKALVQQHAGSDNCQSVDHIMRLPGTMNWPDAKKKAKNPAREAALAEVVYWDDDSYELSTFSKVDAKPESREESRYVAKISSSVERVSDARNDPRLAAVPDAIKALMVSGKSLDKEYGSRSEAQWAVSCALVRAGVDDDTHYAILTDADMYVGQAVMVDAKTGTPRRGFHRYALKQIENAHEAFQAEAKFIRNQQTEQILPNLYENCFAAIKGLGVSLRFDEFGNKTLVEGLEDMGPYLDDSVEIRLQAMVQRTYGFTPKDTLWHRAVHDLARRNKFHPVKNYLRELKWDGTPRVGEMLIRYVGAEDCEFNREVSRLLMVAAVRRVEEPGVKFDEMVVLIGPQGAGKSQFLAILAVNPGWFQDNVSFGSEGMKAVVESIMGHWICEVAELGAMKHADKEHVKVVLSCQVDKARLSYERNTREFPRQCVFVGTTNEDAFLKDMTGNRRFWPVKVGTIDLEALKRDRDQLWAEAYARREESIRLPESLWAEAAARQEKRREVGPFEIELSEALEGKRGWLRMRDIFEFLEVPRERWESNSLMRQISAILKKQGWEKSYYTINGSRSRGWSRGTSTGRLELINGSFTESPAF